MRDLIFVSLEPWDEIWRRNQFLCDELARRFPRRRILFVGRPHFLPVLLRQFFAARRGAGLRALRKALFKRFRTLPDYPNICVHTPLRWFPNPIPGAQKWNERAMARGIARAARKARVCDPLLWLNPPDSGYLVGELGERGVVYDITDDWELAAPVGPRRERIAAQDRDLCRRADLTVVCSQALFDSRQNVARQILLLPNGVNANHYLRKGKPDPRPPGFFAPDGTFENAEVGNRNAEESNAESGSRNAEKDGSDFPTSDFPLPTSNWPRPVFGYTGSLHTSRVDLDLVQQLAREFPHGTVALVGPQYFSDDSLARALEKHPNIQAPGAVAYSQIPDVMANFDVCIVPHLRSEFVESLNPIKLWEFLACGKPIVAVDVAGFRDFPHLVRLAPDAPAFLAACRDALQEVNACQHLEAASSVRNEECGVRNESDETQNSALHTPHSALEGSDTPCLMEQRQAQARGCSWSSRVDELLKAFRATGLDTLELRPWKAPLLQVAGEEEERAL